MYKIDRDLIKKYIKFPLEFDGTSYIFDYDNNMIAQKCHNVPKEFMNNFVEAVNQVWYDTFLQNFDSNCNANIFILDESEMNICITNYRQVISVRGWGRYQYETDGEKIYNEIGNFLTFCCNVTELYVKFM